MQRRDIRNLSAVGSLLLGVLPSLSWAAPETPAPGAASAHAAAPSAASTAAPTTGAPSTTPSASGTTPSAPPVDALVPPKLKNEVQPEYPSAAQEQGIEASVLLEIDIDVTGHVTRAAVLEPSNSPSFGFEDSALVAAKRLEFEPAMEAGKPVAVTVTFRFRFVPKAPAPLPAETSPRQIPITPPTAVEKPAVKVATGELQGRLIERGTRLPLVGVKVTLFRGEGDDAEGFETETDEEGRFKLNELKVGDWRLLADPDGYYPLRTTESVKDGSRTEVSYAIERSAYNPYDVVVDTKRIQREVNHVSIDARQAERVPGTFGDVLAVVKNFPGVAQTTGGGGPFGQGLVIRGSAPEDSRIYASNIDVPLLYHFGNLRSVFPVGMIEKVNFYPGNFSVQYGRATGGIIDIDLKELNRQQFGGYVDVNFFDSSIYLETPITEDLSIAIAGRRSYIDVFLNAILPDTGISMLAPRYYDAQVLATYKPSPEHQFKAFGFLSDDKFEVLFDNPVAADAQTVITDVGLGTNFYRGIAEYKYVPGPRFENELKASFGRDLQHFNVGDALTYDDRLYQTQVRDTARYVLTDNLALRGGLDYVYQQRHTDAKLPPFEQEGEGNNDDPGIESAIEASTVGKYHSIAGFAELELRPWEGMLAIPGFRFDYFGRTQNYASSPRVVLRQTLNKEWLVKGGVGLFQQEPTFNETMNTSGNPDLELERAMHYSAGVEYTPYKHINVSVTGFYKSLYNLVTATDALVTKDGETTPLNYTNDGSGRVIGLEVSAKHELTNNLFAWVAYTLSKSERKDPGADGYRLFDFDQTHILTVTGSYRLPKNWEVGTRFRYFSGSLYTPVTGAVLDADADQYRPISGDVNSARTKGFHQLDIRIDKRWVYESWMLNAYLDIQNVYNQSNVQNIQYNYDYSDTVPQQGLPIVPVLGLRGEF